MSASTAALQRECRVLEDHSLTRRVDSGQAVLEILRWTPDPDVVETLALYAADVESLSRARGAVLAASVAVAAAQRQTIDSLREQMAHVQAELQALRHAQREVA